MPEFDDPRWQQLYEEGQRRIELLKRTLKRTPDGCLEMPFRCYGCDEQRVDFCMLTGDGLPLCSKCFEGTVEGLASHVERDNGC
jgi:hypothetical protein